MGTRRQAHEFDGQFEGHARVENAFGEMTIWKPALQIMRDNSQLIEKTCVKRKT
jgi:hypothetical protein